MFAFPRAHLILRTASCIARNAIQSPRLLASPATSTGHRNLCSSLEPPKDPDAPIEMENPFERERQTCILCKMNIDPDYKNVRLLSQFQSPYTGRIYGRHITGLCRKRQEQVENEINKAQRAGMMPLYHKAPEFLADPLLFNPEKPIRPHKY